MATVDSSTDHHFLHVESLPLVDLRFLSQSELYSLSLCSSSHILRRYDDDAIIPKIDRSVFNESAGSRKQTFSRLRLAPRNNQISSVAASPVQIARQNPEPIDEENTQIIGLLQQLFGVESYGDVKHDDASLVPVQVQFQDPLPESATVAFQSIPIDVVDVNQTKRKRGRPRKNENVGIRVEEKPRKEGGEVMTMVNSNGVLVDALATVNVEDPFGEELKRRTQGLETESSTVAFQNIPIDIVAGGQSKRKRGRPRKNENAGIHIEEKPKDGGEAITMVNKNGVLVNAVTLVNAEDPFGEELKRRTQGLKTESQLLEFMGALNGEWASQRKRRRIVQAVDFGDFLPRGWKIMLSLKRRAGCVWIICRRYISPDGRQFVSCKEVSSYLLSCFGLQDISNLESGHTDGSLRFFSKMVPENGVGFVPTNDMNAINVSSSLLIPSTSVYTDHANQAPLPSSIGSDEKSMSDGNVNNDLASGANVQGNNTAYEMFTDFNHHESLFINERPLKDDQIDKIAVQGCSPQEDKVGNKVDEKLDDVNEVNDVACELDVSFDVTTFSNNKTNGNCEFFDEINSIECMKSGIGNFVRQDGNAGCPETISCGNAQPCVFKSSGYELPVRLVEDHGEQIDFESGKLPRNSEEERCAADVLKDVNISHGNPFENDRWLTNSGNCHSETEDVLTNFKLPCSSEGFLVVQSHIEQKDVLVNGMNRIDGLNIDPNVKVIKDVSDDHGPYNEDVVTSFALEMSSSNEQSSSFKIENPFTRCIEKNLVMPTGDEPHSASNNNSNIVFSGTLETLKAVEVVCKNPQLDIMSCDNDAAVDAYSTTNIMEGRSDPLSGSIPNKFEEGHDGVDNADEFCLSKVAKGDQVEICENDEAF